jgi:ABC-type transporter Mla subunit MlaD
MKRAVAIAEACMLLVTALGWSQSKKDPLTEKQIEEVREAGDDPPQRITLFVGYLQDRSKEIHSLATSAGAQNREIRTHNLLDEFTRLSDDLEDNMDEFNEQHADLRKVLKDLVAKSDAWTTVLNEPKPAPQYDFVRKTALDANRSVHEGAVQMLDDEEKYFAAKKKAEKEAEKKAAQSNSETR